MGIPTGVLISEADATMDAALRARAVRAYEDVVAWTKANAEKLSTYQELARFHGWAVPFEVMAGERSREHDFPPLLVVFGDQRQNAGLGTAPSSHGLVSVLIWPVLKAPFDATYIDTRVTGLHARTMFVHEFTHFIDSLRRKAGQSQSATKSRAGDMAGYFQTPDEFNAYYQEGADRLEDFVVNAGKAAPHMRARLIANASAAIKGSPHDFIKWAIRDPRQAYWSLDFVKAVAGTKWEHKLISRLTGLQVHLRDKLTRMGESRYDAYETMDEYPLLASGGYAEDALTEAANDVLLVPEVAQTSNFSCGAATLMALLRYWGVAKDGETEEKLRGPLMTDTQNGTDPSQMTRLARERGLDSHLDAGLNLDMLASLVREGWTVIVEIQAIPSDVRDGVEAEKNGGHYVVVLGMDGSRVTVMDPAFRAREGNYGWMDAEEFEGAWLDDTALRGVGVVVRSKTGAPGLRGPLPKEPNHVDLGREPVYESVLIETSADDYELGQVVVLRRSRYIVVNRSLGKTKLTLFPERGTGATGEVDIIDRDTGAVRITLAPSQTIIMPPNVRRRFADYWKLMGPKGTPAPVVEDAVDAYLGMMLGEAPIDFKGINLRAKYDEFNRKYFDGELPHDIHLAFKATRGATGTTTAKVITKGPVTSLTKMVRHEGEIRDLAITMNTLIQYDEAEFDAYFLHEMIHAYFAVTGWPFEVHGGRFITKAHEVGQKAGFKIPLTHELKDTDTATGKEREIGVFVVEPDATNPTPLFLFFDLKALGEFQKKAESYVSMFRRPIKLYRAKTNAWAFAPVKRKVDKYGLALSKLAGPVAAHLDLSKAEVMAVVPYQKTEGHDHIKCVKCGRSVAAAGWHHGAPGKSVCRDCHKGEGADVPIGTLVESSGLPEIGSDATHDSIMAAGSHVLGLVRAKKVSATDAVAWAADLMRQFGFDVKRQRSVPRDIDPRLGVFPTNVYNLLLGVKSKEDAAAKRAAKKGAIATASAGGHWPDGRKVPVEGDEVYMMSAGLFGMGAQIQGKVVRSRGELRVAVTGSASVLGQGGVGGVRGKTVPLDASWTVVGDPSIAAKHAAADAARKSKEDARKAEEEKDLADNIALAARHGHKFITSWSQIKVGDVVVSHSRYGPEKPEDWSENAVKITKLHGPHGPEGMRSELSAETDLGHEPGGVWTLDPTGKLYKPPQESFDGEGARDGQLRAALTEVAVDLRAALDDSVLPNRPSNPRDISFDRACFKQTGTKKTWTVGSMAPNYPKKFDSESEAKRWAKKVGREAVMSIEPVMTRVSWTCPPKESVAEEAPGPTKPGAPLKQTVGAKRSAEVNKIAQKAREQGSREDTRHQQARADIRDKAQVAKRDTFLKSESAPPGVLVQSKGE